jgi:phage-related protein (TIGR01555 family)
MPRKRSSPNFTENALGLAGTVKKQRTAAQALDWFMNQAARTGMGSPNLGAGADYQLVRMSYDYWLLITLYRNHWISRRIVDTPAQDMIRTWPKLTSDLEPKDLTRIDRAIRRTMTKQQMLLALSWARLFGGAGCLMVIDGQENELDQPLDLDSVPLGGYKGLLPFDRWAGITPSTDVCTDINRPLDFNKPEHYECRISGGESFKVHASRILRFTGPEVPTPEREAQSWWGISELEPVYEEIQKRDNMSWNILNLTFRANILGMKFPDLAQLLSGLGMSGQAGQQFESRMSAINHLISNQSLVPLPKDGSIESTSYSFAGISEVYQQFQLDISGAAKIPVTRLWGRTITGLGQSNDADERIYEERIATDNEVQMLPQHEKLYPVICMSELGEVPEDLDLQYPSVRVLDEKEKSELAKTVVDTVTVALNSGGISPRTYAKELKQSSDVTGIFTNITDEDIEKLSDDVTPEGELGMFGEGGGEESQLSPSSGPQKVLREEKGKAADTDGPAVRTFNHHGLTCVVETPKGQVRSGKDFAVRMPAHYGYIDGITGSDGDSLDCYYGDGPSNGWVYVVDQNTLDGRKFDEHKVMLNFPSQSAAIDTYKAGHHKGGSVMRDFTPMPIAEFVRWTRTHDMRKPCAP